MVIGLQGGSERLVILRMRLRLGSCGHTSPTLVCTAPLLLCRVPQLRPLEEIRAAIIWELCGRSGGAWGGRGQAWRGCRLWAHGGGSLSRGLSASGLSCRGLRARRIDAPCLHQRAGRTTRALPEHQAVCRDTSGGLIPEGVRRGPPDACQTGRGHAIHRADLGAATCGLDHWMRSCSLDCRCGRRSWSLSLLRRTRRSRRTLRRTSKMLMSAAPVPLPHWPLCRPMLKVLLTVVEGRVLPRAAAAHVAAAIIPVAQGPAGLLAHVTVIERRRRRRGRRAPHTLVEAAPNLMLRRPGTCRLAPDRLACATEGACRGTAKETHMLQSLHELVVPQRAVLVDIPSLQRFGCGVREMPLFLESLQLLLCDAPVTVLVGSNPSNLYCGCSDDGHGAGRDRASGHPSLSQCGDELVMVEPAVAIFVAADQLRHRTRGELLLLLCELEVVGNDEAVLASADDEVGRLGHGRSGHILEAARGHMGHHACLCEDGHELVVVETTVPVQVSSVTKIQHMGGDRPGLLALLQLVLADSAILVRVTSLPGRLYNGRPDDGCKGTSSLVITRVLLQGQCCSVRALGHGAVEDRPRRRVRSLLLVLGALGGLRSRRRQRNTHTCRRFRRLRRFRRSAFWD
mmetsp:Transcript_66947/g.143143  ORF Transcript_66947/g.143143 Transcript_66947/m.143143 type:complete len:627 (+) Transcript_66947:18-1898(+)